MVLTQVSIRAQCKTRTWVRLRTGGIPVPALRCEPGFGSVASAVVKTGQEVARPECDVAFAPRCAEPFAARRKKRNPSSAAESQVIVSPYRT